MKICSTIYLMIQIMHKKYSKLKIFDFSENKNDTYLVRREYMLVKKYY